MFIQETFSVAAVLPSKLKKIMPKLVITGIQEILKKILVSNPIPRGSRRRQENHIEDNDQSGIPDPQQFCKGGKQV